MINPEMLYVPFYSVSPFRFGPGCARLMLILDYSWLMSL